MLAYVFWHWPEPQGNPAQYESRLLDFQKSLAASPPAGFRESAVFRVQGAPWLPTPGAAYEEWYLLEGSAALDPLNDAAVARAHLAYWVEKPTGTSYGNFYSLLRPAIRLAGAVLWGRQMVLGPTREFCLHSPEAIELPPGFSAQRTELTRLWP